MCKIIIRKTDADSIIVENIYQELPAIPMTEMGLQVTPTKAVTSPTTMPKRPRRPAIEELSAAWTLLPVQRA